MKERIERRIMFTMMITLITILWQFLLDGITENDYANFKIVFSIFLFITLYSITEKIITYYIQFNFLLQKVLLFVSFIGLFRGVGWVFGWHMPHSFDQWISAVIIVVPIYIIWYFIDLRNARKIARDINLQIKKREEEQSKL